MGFGQALGSIAGSVLGFIGDRENADAVSDANAANLGFQQRLAAEGIRWKVKDAEAAGIHKLYALGAPTFQATANVLPVPEGDQWKNLGQGIDRAVNAMSTPAERLQYRLMDTQIKGAEIDNEIKMAELMSRKQMFNQLPPGLPESYDSNIIPESSLVRTQYGLRRIPSAEYGQIMENYWPEMLRYLSRDFAYDVRDGYRSLKRDLKRKFDNFFR